MSNASAPNRSYPCSERASHLTIKTSWLLSSRPSHQATRTESLRSCRIVPILLFIAGRMWIWVWRPTKSVRGGAVQEDVEGEHNLLRGRVVSGGVVRPDSSRTTIASPSSGAYSDYLAERAREGRLISKPRLHCDVDDRCGRLPE